MTVSQSLVKWLETFKLNNKSMKIDTELMHGQVAYSLLKEPIKTSKSDILGNKKCIERYTLLAKLANNTNTNTMNNDTWGESLEEWIETQNSNKQFPTLDKGTVTKVTVTTPFVVAKTDTNNSIYQLTIEISYECKGE